MCCGAVYNLKNLSAHIIHLILIFLNFILIFYSYFDFSIICSFIDIQRNQKQTNYIYIKNKFHDQTVHIIYTILHYMLIYTTKM